MVSKRRSRQLSNARAARQYQSIKKPRTGTAKSNPTNFDDNEPSSDDDEPEGPSWYWNNSSDDGISDSDEGGNDIPGYSSESDSEPELPLPPDLSTTQSATLKWEHKADVKLRGGWGAGSQSTKEPQLRNAREFQKQASQCYNIGAMFERAKNMPTKPLEKKFSPQLELENELIQGNLNNAQPLPAACLPPVSQKEALRTLRGEALEILNRLLNFVT